MGTANYSYQELAHQCDLYTGGLNASCHISVHPNNLMSVDQGVYMSSHCLDNNMPYMFNLWEEIFCRYFYFISCCV